MWVSFKKCVKNFSFQSLFGGFQLKNLHFLLKKNYLSMYNYGEIIAHLLTFSVKQIAWFVKLFFLANPPDSRLVLLLPVSWFLVIWALWNWLQGTSHGECVNWLFTIVLHIGKNGSFSSKYVKYIFNFITMKGLDEKLDYISPIFNEGFKWKIRFCKPHF